MAPRLPDEQRAQVAAAIDGIRSQQSIATEFGISRALVGRIAREYGHPDTVWAREHTVAATAAASADNRSRRADLCSRLLAHVELVEGRLFGPYTLTGTTPTGIVTRTLPMPPAQELRNLTAALGLLVDKHLALDKHDSDGGAAAALGLMGRITAAITDEAYRQAPADEEAP